MIKNILEMSRTELNQRMAMKGIKVKIFYPKPSTNRTGTVLFLQKGSKKLRVEKLDKFSYDIAKYSANKKHTTISDMGEEIDEHFS